MLKTKVNYNIKKLGLITVIAVLFLVGCKNKDPELPPHGKHNTVYEFDRYNFTDVLVENPNIQASIDSVQVYNVILRATGDWSYCNEAVSYVLINIGLVPWFVASEKIKGNGLLNFQSLEPADSLWLVQHGYKIRDE